MKHVVISIFIGACVLGCQAERSSEPPQDESRVSLPEVSFIKSIVQRITEEELREYVLALQAMGTRYAPSSGNLKAANYIKEKLVSFGLTDVRLDAFDYYNTETGLYERTRNVVGAKPGSRRPEKIVILGAHFDSVTRRAPDGKTSFQDMENSSPGADDNGTGVAAVLAAARVLHDCELDYTVRFVTFSAEEGGIHGSAHYAAQSARKSEDIVAVINVDMIGYIDQEPEDIDIFANPESEWLLDEMTNNAPVYTPDLLVYRIVDGTYDGSDHGPFWNNGYPALGLMEDYYPSSRLYHTPDDTVETLDFSFALQCTRLAVATLAELAGVRVPDQTAASTEETSVDWKRDSGRRFLFTLSPSANQADVIDISVPGIHARRRIVLEPVPGETWATPRFYPVAVSPTPSGDRVLVTMIRMRAPGDETEGGILRIVDVEKAAVVRDVPLGEFPGVGGFDAEGNRYFQPYWGEERIDIFNPETFERVDRIPSSHPVRKLYVDERGALGVGVSAETDSVLLFDLEKKKLLRRIDEISSPRDLTLVHGGTHALVSSYDQGKIYVIDVKKAEITDTVGCAPQPLHLVAAPGGRRVLTIHDNSGHVELMRVFDEQGVVRLKQDIDLDLGEEVEHATFADDDNLVYFISSGHQRLFGLDLARGDIIWAMRTGDVRARGGVENIEYIHRN